jgi:hypothetical protein
MNDRMIYPMTAAKRLLLLSAFIAGSPFTLQAADSTSMMSKPTKDDASPSKDQVLWTETQLAYDLDVESSYVGAVSTSFGNGQEGDVSSGYLDVAQTFTGRKWLAILWHAGFEWEHFNFSAPNSIPVPDSLNGVSTPIALDFRWSEHHLMRFQIAPGFYSEGGEFDGETFNVPGAIAYSWIPNRRFQLGVGVSYNSLRSSHLLGGGGFRWQISDRWKLKFLLPRPQIEYKAAPALHLWAGTDFRGDTFRLNDHFGTDHGDTRLNRAVIDYQEIRAGTGFSWNIKPLLELNGEVGYMLDRQFNYHTSQVRSSSGKVPYISINLRYLFQIVKDDRSMKAQIQDLENELPWLRRTIRSSSSNSGY